MKYTVKVHMKYTAAPYVRSVFEYLYSLDDDLEMPMDYETSLLLKVFPAHTNGQ